MHATRPHGAPDHLSRSTLPSERALKALRLGPMSAPSRFEKTSVSESSVQHAKHARQRSTNDMYECTCRSHSRMCVRVSACVWAYATWLELVRGWPAAG